jgi:hypothetical protein
MLMACPSCAQLLPPDVRALLAVFIVVPFVIAAVVAAFIVRAARRASACQETE